MTAGDLPWIIPAGLVDDAAESPYLLAPFTLYILLVPDRWYRTTSNRVVLALGALASLGGLLYRAVTEY